MKYLVYIILPLFLTGCYDNKISVPTKQVVISTKCPKFNTRLKIRVDDFNSTHGVISWKDVSRIESFLKSKKNFNKNVNSINLK